MDLSREKLSSALIVSIIPYFLEKGNIWFEQNLDKVLEAKKTQSFFQDNILYLESGQKANISETLRKLDKMGYEKVLKVEDPGEFSQQGGILDIFPINSNFALRLDFLGNTIEAVEKLPCFLKDEQVMKDILKKRLKNQTLYSGIKGLKTGDFVVHLDHGVGKFNGFEKQQFLSLKSQQNSETEEYYVLEYAEGDKLYIPKGLERKLSLYVGFSEPKVSRLGSILWQRTKKRVKEETEKMAKELLDLYVKKETATRPAYTEDKDIDEKIEAGFKYEETPDQVQAIEEITKDLEKQEPMDRIVCGDVGFGKTEVALRTMIKAVESGYQAALIAPTTILAFQHYENFKDRLKGLPIQIGALSRLQSKKEQKETVEKLNQGNLDIVIGTHRLFSKDINFKNLGLLVIDDEQRFGVKQKEKFRQMRSSIDVLSLSATPIPRTMYLALSSLKKISLIQTPPAGRMAVKTYVKPWSKTIIKEAIKQELERKGQVYFLHNRIESIQRVKAFLEKLVPEAKFAVGHGRLQEKELVKIMKDFQNKKIDVLIATTIIENGIDIPNVNTIIVSDAPKLGLAQAYQIRGRIGRSYIQAFAYFLYNEKLEGLAKERLKALKEAEELGSGYRIALKDLEIRGAGNILGKEQSGNVNKVGLNLYCQMLSEAIEKQKSQI